MQALDADLASMIVYNLVFNDLNGAVDSLPQVVRDLGPEKYRNLGS
jgi:hypothetical protein